MKTTRIIFITILIIFCQNIIAQHNDRAKSLSITSDYHVKNIYCIDDSTYYMNYFISIPEIGAYLGNVSKIDENILGIKKGYGVERLVSYWDLGYPISYSKLESLCKKYDYYIGNWSENRQNGEGYRIRSNGQKFFAIWKNGYPIKKTIRKKLTEEELAYTEKMMKRIDFVIENKGKVAKLD